MHKLYLDAQQLLEDSFRLAAKVYDDGFRPTFIVAIWRGGAPIGIAVQEYFSYCDVATDHIAIRTSSYQDIDQQSSRVAVYGISYLIKNLTHEDRVLIVDDVFDTGRSVQAVENALQEKLRLNMPQEVRIAVPYYKPSRNQIGRAPDYYLHETSEWLKYPASLEGLSTEEIAEHRPEIYNIIKDYL